MYLHIIITYPLNLKLTQIVSHLKLLSINQMIIIRQMVKIKIIESNLF